MTREANRLLTELHDEGGYYLGTRSRRLVHVLSDRYGLAGDFEMAEIGVKYGGTSELLLRAFPNLYLHLIDPLWSSAAIARVSPFEGRFVFHYHLSEYASTLWDDKSLDVIFLDANHCYKSVRRDVGLWWPKVKSPGIFSGDDYNCLSERLGKPNWGVKRAVDEFARTHRVKVHTAKKGLFWMVK